MVEQGETHLHALVADGSEVPRPSLQQRKGCVRHPWGQGQPPSSPLALHPTQARSAGETWLAGH